VLVYCTDCTPAVDWPCDPVQPVPYAVTPLAHVNCVGAHNILWTPAISTPVIHHLLTSYNQTMIDYKKFGFHNSRSAACMNAVMTRSSIAAEVLTIEGIQVYIGNNDLTN